MDWGEWFTKTLWPTLQPVVIALLSGLVAEGLKQATKLTASLQANERLKPYLPLVSGVAGGILATVVTDPAYQDLSQQITAGVTGGFAATGIHQAYKQQVKK